MAEGRQVPLSIVLRTVDKATAGIVAVNKRLDELTRPTRDIGKALGDLAESSGMNRVGEAFSRVGGAVTDLLGKVAMVGGAIGVAVAGVLSLVDHFDQLGDTAERLGTSADFLAAIRYAAERAGAPVEAVDVALQTLVQNMGQAKAGTGKMLKFLEQVSPVLARQVKSANSLEEALGLLADAEAKIPDAARRAALAQKTLGDSALAPLLARGSKGIQELLTRYHDLAGAQGDAAEAAGKTDDALKDLHASTEGVKAALVTGLAPALTTVIEQLTAWLVGHRDDIARWAADLGEKVPRAIEKLVEWAGKAYDKVTTFVEGIGGWKVAAVGLAAVIAGPLIASVAALGVALLATPFGQVLLALTPIVIAIGKLVSETEAFEAVAKRLGFASEKGKQVDIGGGISVDEQYAADLNAMMESGRRSAKAEAAAKAALDAEPAVQQARLLQDQRDAMLAIPDYSSPKRQFIDEGAAHRARMAALTAQIDQQAAMHPGPQQAKITIDIKGAPKGTRAIIEPGSTAAVDMTVGHQTGGGAW